MDRELLMMTRDNLMTWLTRAQQETVSVDKKLELLMFSLADLCAALAAEDDGGAPAERAKP